ncbi:tyrosine-type recombinase/integrase [Nonomuraea sp. NPDC050451]|uniref:tyrosine-type recombinase/integrase n=1 Tax=Nonomuraea sp. NPDC050451 TaxID=3364364 RepID=UPI0037938D5B
MASGRSSRGRSRATCFTHLGRAGSRSEGTQVGAEAVVTTAEQADVRIRAYILLSLLTGARTEEVRALTWPHVVAFDEKRKAWLPVDIVGWDHQEFAVYVWRSVRRKGDTKTVKSRRTLKMPARAVKALRQLSETQDKVRPPAGDTRTGADLVFRTKTGTALTATNVRRDFRKVLNRAGLVGAEWTPGSSGTASCRSCPTPEPRSRTSRGW